MQVPVKNKKELTALLLANSLLIKQCGVKALGLFGSFVRDEADEQSDIDFYVVFADGKKNIDNFLQLADLLENITGRNAELVTPQSLNKYIGPHILKEVQYVSLAA